MSTKASYATGRGWHLYEEMMTGSVRVELNDAPAVVVRIEKRWHSVVMELPVDVLEAIGDAHANKSFPHQRRRESR